jgi:hypothetical protein
MKCESCGTVVKTGTAVCPKCDAVLDASAFSTEPPPPEDSISGVGAVKQRGTGSGSKKVVKKKTTTGSAPAAKKPADAASKYNKFMPPAPPRLLKPDPNENPDIDWRQMSKDAVAQLAPVEKFKAENASTPEELAAEAKQLVKSLGFSDKLAAGGSALTILSSFFPWKETFDNGDSLGLMSLGAPVFLAAIAVLSCVIVRVRGLAKKVNPMMLWLTQFGSACFCVLWCLVFIKSAWDPTRTRSPEGNLEMWASSPSIGVVMALGFSAIAVVGSLLGLREKPSR